jgi:CRISPR-associated endonuclease/helicase Cas3
LDKIQKRATFFREGHVVRLAPEVMGWLGGAKEAIQKAVAEVISSETEIDPEVGIDHDRVDAVHDKLRYLLKQVDHPLITAFRGRFDIELYPAGVILRGDVIDEVNATLNNGVPVKLDRHLKGVAYFVESLARSHPERKRIVQAAQQHDIGKKEARFQTMLYGNPFDAAAGPPLAKSALRKLAEIRASYRESGLPRGFRHELASLAMRMPQEESEPDLLVQYLIATHHGYGRPWFPACEDPEAPGVTYVGLGSGWAKAFNTLFDLYGPWHLAGMELLLRASDVRQSKAEQEENNA